MRNQFWNPALLCGVLLVSACAESAPPVVEARGAWCRATAAGAQTAACYLTLISSRADRLIAVSSDAAARTEIHEMRMDGDIMRMRELADGLILPAGAAVALAPGAEHLMLIGLDRPLEEGGAVMLTLRFGHAPPLSLAAPVRVQAPDGEPGGDMARAGH